MHFPIALLVVAWGAQLWAHSTGSRSWRERSRFLETAGVATFPIVVLAGFVDTRGVAFISDPQWGQPLIWHLLAATATVVVWTSHWVWRRAPRAETEPRVVAIDIGGMTLGVWLLVLTGAIAAEMVYAA